MSGLSARLAASAAAFLLVLSAAVGAARAYDTAPDVLVKNVTLEVIDIIQKDQDIQKGDRKKVVALIETKVLPHFNFQTMTASAVGRIASMQARGMIPNYEASMGKMFSSELSQRIARTGTKVFGLYGNVWSLNDEYTKLRSRHTHAYFRTIPSTIAGGSSEIQRNIIATRGLGLPRG